MVHFLSECRSQALSTGLPVTTAPIMPHCLPVCIQNSSVVLETGAEHSDWRSAKTTVQIQIPQVFISVLKFAGKGVPLLSRHGFYCEFSFFPFFCYLFIFYSGPYLASYRARTFLQRPQSFRISATCCLRAAFSRSRKDARTVIWFSLRRRASRERFAARLFFFLLDQYFSSQRNEKGQKEELNLPT